MEHNYSKINKPTNNNPNGINSNLNNNNKPDNIKKIYTAKDSFSGLNVQTIYFKPIKHSA